MNTRPDTTFPTTSRTPSSTISRTPSRTSPPATAQPMAAPRRGVATARVAGALYVIIIGCGLFAELGVRSRLIEPGDPTTTARNILDSPMLFRAGVAADIVMFIADVAIAVVLYQLLQRAQPQSFGARLAAALGAAVPLVRGRAPEQDTVQLQDVVLRQFELAP